MKVGDLVRHATYGWGIVLRQENNLTHVRWVDLSRVSAIPIHESFWTDTCDLEVVSESR
jgi:hypothetical protein